MILLVLILWLFGVRLSTAIIITLIINIIIMVISCIIEHKSRIVECFAARLDKIDSIDSIDLEAYIYESRKRPTKPIATWSDVCGIERAKETIRIIQQSFDDPAVCTPKSVLLFGPAGTGKTSLIKALISHVKKPKIYSIVPSDIQSERSFHELFECARKNKASIICVEHIDRLLKSPKSNFGDEFMRLLVVETRGEFKDDGVIVIGTTDLPWTLDPYSVRYFEKCVYTPLPDQDARLEILKLHFKPIDTNLNEDNFKTLASMTEGFSGSDLATLACKSVYQLASTIESAHWKRPCSIRMVDVQAALESCKPTVDQERVIKHEKFNQEYGQ